MTGLSVRTVQRLEKGQTPSMETLKALASGFEIDLSDLPQEQTMTSPDNAQNRPVADIRSDFSQRWITREEEQAIQHVEHVKGFYMHAGIFLIVMPALIAFNLWISPDVFWFLYVLFPWLFAFALQAAFTFPVTRIFSPEWEKRQVEKQLGRKL